MTVENINAVTTGRRESRLSGTSVFGECAAACVINRIGEDAGERWEYVWTALRAGARIIVGRYLSWGA